MGCPEASWRRLGGSHKRLGGFSEGLRGVLGHLGGILDVSWGKCLKNIEGGPFLKGVLRANMEAKIVKFHVKKQLAFPHVFSRFFCDFSCF